MRKLIILIALFWCSVGFGQVSTNKIQNMATMMLSNSTLYIGGSNFVVNGTQYNASEVVKIYGRDGAMDFLPFSGSIHSRTGIAFYTNTIGTIAGWTFLQDPNGAQSHELGVTDFINNEIRLHFVSNQQIRVRIPFLIASSNLVVSNTVSAAGYQIRGNPGATFWSTNVGIGQTNVLVYTNGLYMGQFTTP